MAVTNVLLDTNAYSAIAIRDEIISAYVTTNKVVIFSSFVLSELYYGFRCGNKEIENKNLLDAFLESSKIPVVYHSHVTIENFVTIKSNLRKIGKPIPNHDIWIAAQAIEFGCQLVTLDNHFRNVEGLDIWPI